MRDFLCSMAWDRAHPTSFAEEELQQSGWTFEAFDEPTLRTELGKLLRWHGMSLSELFSHIDTNQDGIVSVGEFERGVVGLLGFTGPPELLHSTFGIFDRDESGGVSSDELDAWMRGRMIVSKANVREAIRDRLKLHATDADRASMQTPWEVGELRKRLHAALKATHVSVADLVEVWDEDSGKRGKITRRHFIGRFKTLVVAVRPHGVGVGGSAGGDHAKTPSPLLRPKGGAPAVADAESQMHDPEVAFWYAKVKPSVSALFDMYDGDANRASARLDQTSLP